MCGSDKYQIYHWGGREQRRTGEGNLAVAMLYLKKERNRDQRQIWQNVNIYSIWVIMDTWALAILFSSYVHYSVTRNLKRS